MREYVCFECGKKFTKLPSISHIDHQILCPECCLIEALLVYGVSDDIIQAIVLYLRDLKDSQTGKDAMPDPKS